MEESGRGVFCRRTRRLSAFRDIDMELDIDDAVPAMAGAAASDCRRQGEF